MSGFDNYTVIWNLNKVLQGEIDSYIITKAEGALVQVDFKYNDPSKLLMTTSNGIVIKQNKIKKWSFNLSINYKWMNNRSKS